MRTYKSKKPIYEEIENVHDLCRLCLERVEDGVPIYKDGQDMCALVATRIMICVGLEMKHDQLLPNMVCKRCHEELEKHYKFRRKCQMSYQKLKHHVLALKLKQNNKIDVPFENILTTEPVEDVNAQNMKGDENLLLHLKEPSQVVENISEKPVMVKQLEKMKPVEIEKMKPLEIEEMKPVEMEEMKPNKIEEMKRNNIEEIKPVEIEERKLNEVEEIKSVDVEEMKPTEVEEVQIPLQSVVNPDISTFLSTILTELGILSRENGLLHHQGISTFELEIGDREQLVMELVEEDEPVDSTVPDPEDMVIEVKPYPVTSKAGKSSRAWCSECGRAFSSGSALARHARVHSGARPHVCAACGAAFAQKAVLHRHMLVHLDVRPHRCSECSKSFTQRAALAAHARSHAAPPARALALHRCSVCDKVFLYASGLSRHMVTHNGQTYECSSCDKRFRDKSSLMRHRRNVCRKIRS